MQVEIDIEKSVEENAAVYFERAKKARKKLDGLRKAIEATKERVENLEKEGFSAEAKPVKNRKKQWFDSFHWFFSSNGFLVIAGKDAKSNEVIVKKHLEENDLFLHADIHGAGACVIKANSKEVPFEEKKEAACFAGVFSRAWKQGIASVDVFAVNGRQVSKSAPSGESLGTGAFMVYGKREWFRNVPMEIFVGLKQDDSGIAVVSGPEQAIKKHCTVILKIVQGSDDSGKTAKIILSVFARKLGSKLGIGVDDIVKALPAGNMRVVQ